MKRILFLGSAALVLCLTGAPAAAAVFTENFSGAAPGPNSSLSGTAFAVTSGAVDIVGQQNGSFFSCDANLAGNCLDLVGSPGNGAIQSSIIPLVAGGTYTINFTHDLQGFNTGDPVTALFTVALGSFSQQLAATPSTTMTMLSFVAALSDPNARLSFIQNTAPDSVHGAVLSDISVDEMFPGPGVPEPASWALLIAGFGIAGTALRRRRGALPVVLA